MNQQTAILKVKVVPGASNTKIMGWLGDALKIRVVAPPEKGKANQAVIKHIAKVLAIGQDQIELSSGQTSPHKTFVLHGITQQGLDQLLAKIK